MRMQCLYACALFAALFVTPCSAATVDLAWTGAASPEQDELVSIDSGATYNSFQAGTYHWNVTNNGAPSVVTGSILDTYCIEISQLASTTPHTYTILGPGFGAYVAPFNNASTITAFFNQYYTLSLTATQQEAFQLSIWELVMDGTPGSLTGGQFRVQGSDTVTAQANTWLSLFNTSTTGNWTVYQAHNDEVQDQIFALQGGGAGQGAPLPAAVVGGMVLMGGLASLRAWRHKARA